MLSRTDLVTWVLGAVAKPIETRVQKLVEKEQKSDLSSVARLYVRSTRNVDMPHPTPPQPTPSAA